MPTAVGTAAQGGVATQTSPLNITHNSGATGSRRCLVVDVYAFDGGGNITGITYAGVALTLWDTTNTNIATDGQIQRWYLVNPATGSNTLAITASQTMDEMFAIVQTWENVNQTTPLSGFQENAATSNAASIPALTLSGSDIGLGSLYAYDSSTWTITESDTIVLETQGTAAASGRAMQTGDANLSWTLTNTPAWMTLGSALVHDAGGGGGTINTETLSDAAVIGDEGLRQVVRNRRSDDAVTVSDAMLRTAIHSRLAEDVISLIDEAIANYIAASGTIFTQTLTDTVTLTDTALAYVVRRRLIQDAITITEPALVSSTDYRVTATSEAAVSDETRHWMLRLRTLADSLSILDEGIANYIPAAGGSVTTQTVTDTVTISDSGLPYMTRGRVADDGVAVDDGSVQWFRRFRMVEDSLSILDELVAILTAQAQVKVLSDSVSVSDEALTIRHVTALASDAVTIIDALLSGIVRQVLTVDAIDVTDAVVLQKHITRQLDDAVEINDAVERMFRLTRVLQDDVTASDSVVSQFLPYVEAYGTTRAAVGMLPNPVAVGMGVTQIKVSLGA